MKNQSSVIARHHFALKIVAPALAVFLLFASFGISGAATKSAYAGDESNVSSQDVAYAINRTDANSSGVSEKLGNQHISQVKKKDKADNSKGEKKKSSESSAMLMRGAIAIGVAVLVFVIIAIVTRQIRSRSADKGKDIPELSKPKKIAIMVITAIVTYGILSIVTKAHAVEASPVTSATKSYVATLEGDISVDKNGVVKATIMKLRKSPQTKLAISAFDKLGNAAGIASQQIKSGELSLPAVDVKEYYKPIASQLINNLLKKHS